MQRNWGWGTSPAGTGEQCTPLPVSYMDLTHFLGEEGYLQIHYSLRGIHSSVKLTHTVSQENSVPILRFHSVIHSRNEWTCWSKNMTKCLEIKLNKTKPNSKYVANRLSLHIFSSNCQLCSDKISYLLKCSPYQSQSIWSSPSPNFGLQKPWKGKELLWSAILLGDCHIY